MLLHLFVKKRNGHFHQTDLRNFSTHRSLLNEQGRVTRRNIKVARPHYCIGQFQTSYVTEIKTGAYNEMHVRYILSAQSAIISFQGPIQLLWIHFHHSMDKLLHTLWGVGWNYSSILNFSGAIVDVWKWKIISSHALLGMLIPIPAGIKVNPCY